MTLTFTNPDTDPCLAAFIDEMRARHVKAERDESGPCMFKDPRIEKMWEGFVCGWMMRGHHDEERMGSAPPDADEILRTIDAVVNSHALDMSRSILDAIRPYLKRESFDNWQLMETAPRDGSDFTMRVVDTYLACWSDHFEAFAHRSDTKRVMEWRSKSNNIEVQD